MAATGWKRRLLVTLEDAAEYIQKLPQAEQLLEEWQAAAEALLLLAVELNGPTMMARIGAMRALNRTSCGSLIPHGRIIIGGAGN